MKRALLVVFLVAALMVIFAGAALADGPYGYMAYGGYNMNYGGYGGYGGYNMNYGGYGYNPCCNYYPVYQPTYNYNCCNPYVYYNPYNPYCHPVKKPVVYHKTYGNMYGGYGGYNMMYGGYGGQMMYGGYGGY